MSPFWQRVTLTVIAGAAVVVSQLWIKDPVARSTLTGIAGTLLGWAHLPSPGAAS